MPIHFHNAHCYVCAKMVKLNTSDKDQIWFTKPKTCHIWFYIEKFLCVVVSLRLKLHDLRTTAK
jgi:hypothetical protein